MEAQALETLTWCAAVIAVLLVACAPVALAWLIAVRGNAFAAYLRRRAAKTQSGATPSPQAAKVARACENIKAGYCPPLTGLQLTAQEVQALGVAVSAANRARPAEAERMNAYYKNVVLSRRAHTPVTR